MKIYSKIILTVFCILCTVFSAQAQEAPGRLSISDFVMQRITPVKTTSNVQKQSQPTQAVQKKLTNENNFSDKKVVEQAAPIFSTKKEIAVETTNTSTKNKVVETPIQPQEQYTGVSQATEEQSSNEDVIPQNSENKLKADNDKINKINEAYDKPAENISPPSDFGNSGKDFLKAFSSLFVVILLIFVFAWIYARLKGINPTAILTGNFAEKNLNKLNVVSTSTLGQGKDIHLVEVNGKQLVIGSTTNNINLLTEISAEELEKLKEKSKTKNAQYSENTDGTTDNEKTDYEELDELYGELDPDVEYDEFEEDNDFISPDHYASKYSEVYKDYIDK